MFFERADQRQRADATPPPSDPIRVQFTLSACGQVLTDENTFYAGGSYCWSTAHTGMSVGELAVKHEDVFAWLAARGGVLSIRARGVLRTGIGARAMAALPPPPPLLVALSPTLAGQLRALLSDGAAADCTLVYEDSDRPCFAAHSLLLSLRSPYFKAELDPTTFKAPVAASILDASAAAAGRDNRSLRRVVVPVEIEPPVLQKVLEFIYTDEVEFADVEEVRAAAPLPLLLAINVTAASDAVVWWLLGA